MPEIEQQAPSTGGTYFPIPPQGCESAGISLRDHIAEQVFVRLLGDAFAACIGQEIEINAKDFAVQSFIAADKWLATRAVV